MNGRSQGPGARSRKGGRRRGGAAPITRPRYSSSPLVVFGFWLLASLVAIPLAPCWPQAAPAPPQEPNLVDNGEFDQLAADGWLQGWERVEMTADATVQAVPAEGGNAAVKLTGTTGRSKAGIQAPIKPFGDETVLRVALRYRADKGGQTVIIRQESSQPKGKPTDQRFPLGPSRDWRPFETTVTVEPVAEGQGAKPGKWSIVLLHEGPGETWFDGVQVLAGLPAARPAQPPMPETGPYAIQYSPADGAVVSVNPPWLRWPAKRGATYRAEWSTSPDFPPEATKRAEGLILNLFAIPEVLAPGAWFWRVTEIGAASPSVPTAEELAAGETPPTEEEAGAKGPPEQRKPPPPGPGRPPPTGPGPGAQASGAPVVSQTPKPRTSRSKLPKPEGPTPPSKRGAAVTPPSPGGETPPPPEEASPPSQPTASAGPAKGPPRATGGVRSLPVQPGPGGPPPPRGMPGLGPSVPPGGQPHAPIAQPSVSPTRSFRVDESAAKLPVPVADAILAALPPHPRVWLTTDGVIGLRARCEGPLKSQWDALVARLESAKGKELPAEPKPLAKSRKPGPKDLGAAAEILKVATQESGLVRDLAFASLVSGEASYADEAKRRVLNLAGWKPDGSTGYAGHDQADREITLALALALDWLPQSLSTDEKKEVTEALVARGQALLKALSEWPRPLNQFPYSSHGQTAIGFLTIIGLAAAGEVPEAEAWVKFALPTAVGLFSPWAGDDGGWMQGDYYWKRSAYYTFQLFDALRTAAGVDLYALPWSQNTARCETYMHPPYSQRGGFGDGPEVPPDARDRQAMWRLASARNDPLAAWYAQSVPGADPPPTALDLIWRDPGVQPKAPDTLPPSAAFKESGLFAMHSALTDPRGVHLYGRASAFGSFNHAHADQNSFRLDSFGEPLLIDAGYYDSYRSPHETVYARTSLAHNTLLVSGKGQRTGDITADGKLERFVASEAFDFAQTEASGAYPPPSVKTFRRSFLFCRPSCIVIWDHIEATEKVALTWQLHSLDQPTLDAANSVGVFRHKAAAVAVGAFGSQKLAWQTISKFPKNPAVLGTEDQAAPQWHTSLIGQGKVDRADQLLILAPFEGDAAPKLKSAEVKGGVGAEATASWGKTIALVRTGDAPVASGDLTADAACLVLKAAEGGGESVFADQLKSLKRGETVLLSSTVACLVSGTLGEKPSLVFDLADKTSLTVALAAQPAKLLVDGQEQPVSWANGVLTVELPAGRHEVRVAD